MRYHTYDWHRRAEHVAQGDAKRVFAETNDHAAARRAYAQSLPEAMAVMSGVRPREIRVY